MTTTTPPTTLTDRDQAILTAIARGYTRRQTGRLLGMTERHVQSRLRTIARRLDLPTAHQAVVMAATYRLGIMRNLAPEPRHPVFLPERQRQILRLMGHGRTDTEIGAELGITADTVGTHAIHLFDAIGARNRAHAVALDHQHRFRDTDHQWQLLAHQYNQRVTARTAATVHAYDGQRTACNSGVLTIGDRWPIATEITCRSCATFLGITPAQHTNAA